MFKEEVDVEAFGALPVCTSRGGTEDILGHFRERMSALGHGPWRAVKRHVGARPVQPGRQLVPDERVSDIGGLAVAPPFRLPT